MVSGFIRGNMIQFPVPFSFGAAYAAAEETIVKGPTVQELPKKPDKFKLSGFRVEPKP